ncbi:hypothetical protein BaRGS_00011745 [Batillaria attramentaria]|uniref:Uncharacterized protein n=1 Tax=Batillaria attramentaria TaxID=370345 RepID=A0ABD0LBW8_9CAEN
MPTNLQPPGQRGRQLAVLASGITGEGAWGNGMMNVFHDQRKHENTVKTTPYFITFTVGYTCPRLKSLPGSLHFLIVLSITKTQEEKQKYMERPRQERLHRLSKLCLSVTVCVLLLLWDFISKQKI